MSAAEFIPYIGLPYLPNGRGPDAYDCWGLLRHIQARHFNTPMPEVPIGDAEATRQIFETKVNMGDWVAVDMPRHGDGVLLRGGRHPHVGVWLDIDSGGVLHAMENIGVIFSHPRALPALGFGRIKFYRILK